MTESIQPRPLLRVEELSVHYKIRQGWAFRATTVRAVDDVSVSLGRAETLGIVGESGSGKTTLGRAVLRRVTPASGSIWFDDLELSALKGEDLRRVRRHFQCVFQDPFGSLNPRRRVGTAIAEPLVAHGIADSQEQARDRVSELLGQVGLPAEAMDSYPQSFSGGQLQRISIARALAARPSLIVADEPVSALDVSIQAQVTNLLQDLQDEMGVAYIFISHDIAVVRRIATTVAVMYAGQVVEYGVAQQVLTDPVHPYTQALVAAVPSAHRDGHPAPPLQGESADPTNPPSGCRFRTRCPIATDQCAEATPPLEHKQGGTLAACWRR